MSEKETIPKSMGDFVTLLIREISQSLSLARYEAPLVQVQQVRVRFGEEGGSDSMIVNRYPFMANGWEVELLMNAKLQARLYGQPIPTIEPRCQLLDIFGEHPVSAIKGVSTDWAGFFQKHRIQTIRTLASLSMEGFQALAKERNSVRLWEIHGKARLLQCEIPFFPSTPLDGETLYALLKMSPETLLNRAGLGKTSLPEIQRLADYMEILAIVIDTRVLQAIPLKTLLNC